MLGFINSFLLYPLLHLFETSNFVAEMFLFEDCDKAVRVELRSFWQGLDYISEAGWLLSVEIDC